MSHSSLSTIYKEPQWLRTAQVPPLPHPLQNVRKMAYPILLPICLFTTVVNFTYNTPTVKLPTSFNNYGTNDNYALFAIDAALLQYQCEMAIG